MKKLWFVLLIGSMVSTAAASENGLLRKASPYSVNETVRRLETAIRAKGMKVFPRVDHAAAAEAYGLTMRPTVVVSFGNPKYGTPFMMETPESGIDFPPKAIVYEDRQGKVWLAFNSAEYLYGVIFKRHGLQHQSSDVDFYRQVLEKLADAAVNPDP
jgi:uncharacterized protein (DUF302 family)